MKGKEGRKRTAGEVSGLFSLQQLGFASPGSDFYKQLALLLWFSKAYDWFIGNTSFFFFLICAFLRSHVVAACDEPTVWQPF